MTDTSRSPSATTVNRRSLLEGSVALAAATAIPGGAFAAGSDRIRVGLVGCGGRGVGAALQAIAADAGVVIAALGDRFADQLDAAAATLASTAASCTSRSSICTQRATPDTAPTAALDTARGPPCPGERCSRRRGACAGDVMAAAVGDLEGDLE